MVPGVSLLLRALLLLLLLLWGCRDAQPARLGHPELRQEAEVRCVPGREGTPTAVPSERPAECPRSDNLYTKRQDRISPCARAVWDHTGLRSRIDYQGQESVTRLDRQAG